MNCPGIPEISYLDWSSSFYGTLIARRTPLAGSLELTIRCNNNCIHCYCNKPLNDPGEIASELSTKEIFRILDEIADELYKLKNEEEDIAKSLEKKTVALTRLFD